MSHDLPHGGALDLFHNVSCRRSRTSNALYALRSTAIEDLLKTRRDLKILLGGTQYARYASQQRDLSFEVPSGVIELYALGPMDLGGPADPRDVPCDGRGAASTGEGSPEFLKLIQWLSESEPAYDPALRGRLLWNLMQVSAEVTQLDQSLKFIQEDYWNHPAIQKEFYEAELKYRDLGLAVSGSLYNPALVHDVARKYWLERHDMDRVLAIQAGFRDRLLSRYAILNTDLEGKPLYKHIYSAMETLGFPKADLVQAPVTPHLPPGKERIPLPGRFDQAVADGIRSISGSGFDSVVGRIAPELNHRIDQALMTALEVNTSRLTELTSIIDFDGSDSSPLLELARFEELWSATLEKYGYLEGYLDLEQAHADLRRRIEGIDARDRVVNYGLWAGTLGLGIAATVVSFGATAEVGALLVEGAEATGAAATLLGIPVRGIFAAGMLIDAAHAGYVYVNAEKAAQVSRELFLGTKQSGSLQMMRDTGESYELSGKNFRFAVASLLTFGALEAATLVAEGATLVGEGENAVIRLNAKQMTAVRQAMDKVGAGALTPAARTLYNALSSLLKMTTGADTLVSFEKAVAIVAHQTRMAPKQVLEAAMKVPVFGGLIRALRLRQGTSLIIQSAEKEAALAKGLERVKISSSFLRKVLRNQVAAIGITLGAEVGTRGKKAWTDPEERRQTAIDVVIDMGLNLTADIIFGSTFAAEKAEASSALRRSLGYTPVPEIKKGFFHETQAGKHLRGMGILGGLGVLMGGSTVGVSEFMNYLKSDERPGARTPAESVLFTGKQAAYNGVFLATSSYWRSYAVERLGKWLETKVAAGSGRDILITGVSSASLGFGTWHFVKIAKLVGVMEEGSDQPQAPASPDPEKPQTGPVRIENLGGVYLKLDEEAADGSYLFDFLQK